MAEGTVPSKPAVLETDLVPLRRYIYGRRRPTRRCLNSVAPTSSDYDFALVDSVNMSRERIPVPQLIATAYSHGAPFAKRLSVHSSSVNALSWSSDGRWLASAGDDKRVVLWDFHPRDDTLSSPIVCSGPRENVTCLAFSASNSYLYSGSLDTKVLQYDMSHMTSSAAGTDDPISSRFSGHDGSIRAVSPHPRLDHMVLTGSDDGRVILNDFRTPMRDGVGSMFIIGVTDVRYHPTMEHVFVTSDMRGSCHLRDLRMVFGGQNDEPNAVLKYVTKLAMPGGLRMCNPEVSSLVFDSTGTRLAITMQNHLPAIFDVSDEWPVATCSGAALSSQLSVTRQLGHGLERGYENYCTVKQGSFGSSALHSEALYGTGSDDFRGYVWKVPDLAQLASLRREYNYAGWTTEVLENTIGFAKSPMGQRVVPVELERPQFRLYGHNSIVNTVSFHPFEPYVATAGVERHVFVHSPFEATAAFGALPRTEESIRLLPSRNEINSLTSLDNLFEPFSELNIDDRRIILYFDDVLRSESGVDIWATREWRGGDSSDSSNSSSD